MKRKLAEVSEEEWAAIPEVGDARNKEKRNPRAEKFTPVPDSIIAMNMGMGQVSSMMDHRIQSGLMTPMGSGLSSTLPGFATPMAQAFSGFKTSVNPGTSTDLDLQKIGQARNRLMDIRLNQVRSFVISALTLVDPL